MNRVNVAIFFAALLVVGACAEPRKMLADTEESKMAEAEQHQRILAELEEVSALRERMLQEGMIPAHRCSLLRDILLTPERCVLPSPVPDALLFPGPFS